MAFSAYQCVANDKGCGCPELFDHRNNQHVRRIDVIFSPLAQQAAHRQGVC